MFGQNNDSQNQPQDPAAQNPVLQNSAPPADFLNPGGFPQPQAPAADPSQAPAPAAAPTDFGAPMIMDSNPTDFTSPATPDDMAASAPAPATLDPMAAPSAPVSNDALLSMKQEALQQLTPLVSHLDQSPEEKFRTVMMMIQASDDHTKLNEAFEIAKQITDDKVRAQALLDVINEINYFTQHNGA